MFNKSVIRFGLNKIIILSLKVKSIDLSLAAIFYNLDLKPMPKQLFRFLLDLNNITCRSRSISHGFTSAAAYIVCVLSISILSSLPSCAYRKYFAHSPFSLKKIIITFLPLIKNKTKHYLLKNNITTPICRAIYNFIPSLKFLGGLEMLA